MITALGQAGAQSAYSAAGLDSNNAVAGGAPCATCAFPGITPNGSNFVNTAIGPAGNGSLGTLDTLEPIGRSVYSGLQISLKQQVQHPIPGVKSSNFQFSYSLSKFTSQVQDQDFVNLPLDNDEPLRFTGPNALDRTHQFSFGGTFDLPLFTRLSLIGHFYSPLPDNISLPELTSGGEIYATDWLGSGFGSNQPGGMPVPGTNLGEFQRGVTVHNMQNLINHYNSTFAGSLTPAGSQLVTNGVMSSADMTAMGWVMPSLANVAPGAVGFPWLKSFDLKAAWPIKVKERLTIEPSASIFNIFNFSNSFLPGNLPGGTSGTLSPGGAVPGTLSASSIGGVTPGANLVPFRASFQSGTYALGAPRQFEFGLRIAF